MSGSSSAPAIEAVGLVKEFERGRRTLWQRLRREPDLRERFRAVDGVDLLALGALEIAIAVAGRWVFRRTEHHMRVQGTLGQH